MQSLSCRLTDATRGRISEHVVKALALSMARLVRRRDWGTVSRDLPIILSLRTGALDWSFGLLERQRALRKNNSFTMKNRTVWQRSDGPKIRLQELLLDRSFV
jgi:hypothetical protein